MCSDTRVDGMQVVMLSTVALSIIIVIYLSITCAEDEDAYIPHNISIREAP